MRLLLVLLFFGLGSAAAQNDSDRSGAATLQSKILGFEAKVLDIQGDFSGLVGKSAGMEVKETDTELKIELSGDVLFDFDKANIRSEAEPTLKQVSDLLSKYPKAKVAVDGYTDSKGKDEYNLRLSTERAQAVKRWLLAGGSSRTIVTRGLGEANPVALNTNSDGSDNPEGRQKNRRVEITIKKG